MSNNKSQIFKIQNETFKIHDFNGVYLAKVYVTTDSTTNGKVQGENDVIGGISTTEYNVEPGDRITLGSGEQTINYLKIKSPDSNCTIFVLLETVVKIDITGTLSDDNTILTDDTGAFLT